MKTIKFTCLALLLLGHSLVSEKVMAESMDYYNQHCLNKPASENCAGCTFGVQSNPSTGVKIESYNCTGGASKDHVTCCKRDFTRMTCGYYASCVTTEGFPITGTPDYIGHYPGPCRWTKVEDVPGAWKNSCPLEEAKFDGCRLRATCYPGYPNLDKTKPSHISIDLSSPIHPNAHVEVLPGGDRHDDGMGLYDNN